VWRRRAHIAEICAKKGRIRRDAAAMNPKQASFFGETRKTMFILPL
jgi:hypothetical protein